MGISQHIHTVITTDVSPDLGELAEIIYDLNVKTIPLHYHWGCRTFQNASHIHVIHTWGVWTPETVVDGHMAAHSYRYTTEVSPDLEKFSEIIDDVNVEKIPLRYYWDGRTFQTASHIHVIHIYGVWTSIIMSTGIWQHTHTVTTTDVSSDLGKYSEVIDDVSVEMIPLCYCWGCRTFQTASHIHVIQILGAWTP
jgi:hypothetical protein